MLRTEGLPLSTSIVTVMISIIFLISLYRCGFSTCLSYRYTTNSARTTSSLHTTPSFGTNRKISVAVTVFLWVIDLKTIDQVRRGQYTLINTLSFMSFFKVPITHPITWVSFVKLIKGNTVLGPLS